MNEPAITAQCDRWQARTLIAGIIGAALSLIGAVFNHAQFFHSYLFAWLFWVGLSFGALVVVMMQVLTGGKWGAAVRNLSVAAFMTLPLMAFLFLPVLLGVHDIYGWSLGVLGEAPGYHHKEEWLNLPFFVGRSVFYFVIIITIAFFVRRWLNNNATNRLSALSAGGLIVYVFCMNFASTDWVMSLDPKWYSTVFVEVFVAGQFIAALALMTALLAAFSRNRSVREAIPTKAFHDLGNMLLAFIIFWIYVAFAQFLIIWSGNLPREISWYLARSSGGWQWLALVLMIFEFLLPFFLLLSREAKRREQRLAVIALCIVLANVINNYWLVAPSFHPRGIYLHWLDLTVWLALGGFWFALFFYFLKQRPLLPRQLLEVTQHA